ARSANIPTHPSQKAKLFRKIHFSQTAGRTAFALVLLLCFGLIFSASAQSSKKKKKAKKRTTPCATCKPQTAAPEIATSTADDAAAVQQLSEIARSLHDATPGSYEKLAAFASKHSNDVWGARAALTLGYDDYQKNRAAQALAWFNKAKGDTVLDEYVLFWRAQANRALKKNADAFTDLQKIINEYPSSAKKEQVLELF